MAAFAAKDGIGPYVIARRHRLLDRRADRNRQRLLSMGANT